MSDHDDFLPSLLPTPGLSTAIIWFLFTLIWLSFTSFSTRHSTLTMELFLSFITFTCSLSGFIPTFLRSYTDLTDDFLPLSCFIYLSKAMFLMLQFLLSRGYGLTRYELTIPEIMLFWGGSVAGMVAGVKALTVIVYLGVFCLGGIYGYRTYRMLGQQNPAFTANRNLMIRKKRKIFVFMAILACFAFIFSIFSVILRDKKDENALNLNTILVGFSELLFAHELMLLQLYRNDPDFSHPLVLSEEIYQIQESLLLPEYQYYPVESVYPYSHLSYGHMAYAPPANFYPASPYR